jgi:geranylgeranyl pyrophosphate synthase
LYINGNTDITTTEKLNKLLEHAKNRKSPVLDNLTMQLLKFGGKELKVYMVEVFSKVVDKSHAKRMLKE